jgi:hypothetical protein
LLNTELKEKENEREKEREEKSKVLPFMEELEMPC